MNPSKTYLSADEVIEQLGINKATLYSYVSRGLIRSEETQGKTRNRRYWAEDVEALYKRKETRRNPERAAEGSLDWGDPLLESSITLIDQNRLFYRGFDVAELVQQRSFEEVATLLWTGRFEVTGLFAQAILPIDSLLGSLLEKLVGWQVEDSNLRAIDRFQIILPLAAERDWAAFDLEARAVAKTGARILQLLAAIACQPNQREVSGVPTKLSDVSRFSMGIPDTSVLGGYTDTWSLAQQLQRAWSPDDSAVLPLLNSALILCADHELNVSSFTARCVASAGSTPYAVVNAGLSALQGFRHGGHSEQVEALLNEAALNEAATHPRQTIRDRLKRGEIIPGFGHNLYPEGDPRAQLLLAQIAQACPNAPTLAIAQEISDSVERAVQRKPNIDFALGVLAQSFALPMGAPLTLFALARVVGWIAHAIEQYQSHQLIRPRARYNGKMPEEN